MFSEFKINSFQQSSLSVFVSISSDKRDVMIVLLSEFTVRLARNAWTQYNELYRACLCQAGTVSVCLCVFLCAPLSSPDVFHCLGM